MIHYVEGDILLSQSEAIAHGLAPGDNFKQGLALALREKWPSLYKDFRHFCKTYHPKEGSIWSWKGAGGPVIVNLLTQEPAKDFDHPPGKANLPNINHSLKELARYIQSGKISSLAITKLATGVGGMDWNDVKPLVEKHLGDLGIPVFVYETYRPKQQAQEPGTEVNQQTTSI